jgi:hypothetical protein
MESSSETTQDDHLDPIFDLAHSLTTAARVVVRALWLDDRPSRSDAPRRAAVIHQVHVLVFYQVLEVRSASWNSAP